MSINAITGYSGCYTGRVQNPSIAYGMNAANNMEIYTRKQAEQSGERVASLQHIFDPADDETFVKAVEGFSKKLEQDEFTPMKYRYQYSTVNEGEFDKLSLMGAAYEEMGRKKKISNRKMSDMINQAYFEPKTSDKKERPAFSAKVLDTNRNGQVEVDEYGAFLALSDIKSKDKNSTDVSIMDGNITDEGVQEALSYLAVNTKNPIQRWRLTSYMRKVFKGIQKDLGLKETNKEFKKELNYIA